MPHAFVKPSLVVQTAVEILQRQRVLQALVTTDGLGDFGGSANDTINIRVPAIAGAHTRTLRASDRTLSTDDLVEYNIPVQLTEHVYSAIKLTDEQRTLDIQDFARQVLKPQVSAVAYKLEDLVADLIDSADYDEVLAINPSDTFPAFVDARRKLNDNNVPDSDRILVVGSAVEAQILKDDQFRQFQQSGDANVLRRAYLVRLRVCGCSGRMLSLLILLLSGIRLRLCMLIVRRSSLRVLWRRLRMPPIMWLCGGLPTGRTLISVCGRWWMCSLAIRLSLRLMGRSSVA